MVDFTDGKIAGVVTRPWYVIDVQLGQRMYHLSTGGAANWYDKEYQAGRIAEKGFTADDTELSLRLINENYQFSAAALRGDFHGGLVQAWYAPRAADALKRFYPEGYVEKGYEKGDMAEEPSLVFSGRISEITEIGTSIGIRAMSKKIGGFPSVRIMPPIANFTAPAGTKITYRNRIYLIEKR